MTISAKVFRRTRKGDWMARTKHGVEVLLPGRDSSLRKGVEVELNGIRQGNHVNFPTGYTPATQTQRVTPVSVISTGVIIRKSIEYHGTKGPDFCGQYYEAETSQGTVNVQKVAGPQGVTLGTMVDILHLNEGVRHRYCNNWRVADTQYPINPLSVEQRVMADAFIANEVERGGGVGTVVVHNSLGMVVLDDEKVRPGSYGQDANIRTISSRKIEPLPIGTRVAYGLRHEGERSFMQTAVLVLDPQS